MRGITLGLSVSLFVYCVPSVALGQSTEAQTAEAQSFFQRGQLAFQQERWPDCARHFERSFALVFSGELLYNIGVCYERAADAVEGPEARQLMERAIAAYRRYGREQPDAEDADAVRGRAERLREALPREVAATSIAETEASPPQDSPVSDAAGDTSQPPPVATATPVLSSAEVEGLHAPPVGDEPSLAEGFGFPLTVAAGLWTVVTFAVAVATGVYGQSRFDTLGETCGMTELGCSDSDIDDVEMLETVANVFYIGAAVGIALGGVALAVEVSAHGGDGERSARLRLRGAF